MGSLGGGPLNDYFGAKKICLVMAVVVILNWALTAFGVNFFLIILSRVVSGACYGIFLALGMFFHEASKRQRRI